MEITISLGGIIMAGVCFWVAILAETDLFQAIAFAGLIYLAK